jgi:hypothetical protein
MNIKNLSSNSPQRNMVTQKNNSRPPHTFYQSSPSSPMSDLIRAHARCCSFLHMHSLAESDPPITLSDNRSLELPFSIVPALDWRDWGLAWVRLIGHPGCQIRRAHVDGYAGQVPIARGWGLGSPEILRRVDYIQNFACLIRRIRANTKSHRV